MINSYNDIYNRVNAINQAIPLLEQQNNKEKIENIKNEVLIYKELVKIAITLKKNSIVKLKPDKKITDLENQYNKMLEYKKLYSISQNFYEGLGINKLYYRIDHPDTLEKFNDNIIELLNILKELNIQITKDDFNYTERVNKYMNALIDYKEKDNFKEIMKNTYDGIYFEEQDILENISINIKKIIYRYEDTIKGTTINNLNTYSMDNNIDKSNILTYIDNIKQNITKLKETDLYYMVKLFIKNNYNPFDYSTDSKIIKSSINYFNSNYYDQNEHDKHEFIENVYYLKYDLDEYKNFLKYSFIIKDAYEIVSNKDIDIDDYEIAKKEISAINLEYEKTLSQLKKLKEQKDKILGKNTMTFITEKNKIDKVGKIDDFIKKTKEQLNSLSKDIKQQQALKDKLKFNKCLLNSINEDTKIYDVFNLYSKNNLELYECIKKEFNISSIEEIENEVMKYNNYIDDPDIKIINNIKFNEFDNIKEIIEKKYNLLNIIFDLSNLEETLNNSNNIYNFRNIIKGNIDLSLLNQYKEIMKDES